MREFAEQELVIPDGPHKGRRFNVRRQPYAAVWLAAVMSGAWQRIFTTGPTQSGKTLLSFVLPIMFHLFEMQETVICGVPDMNMSDDKWQMDLLPAIEASRYRDLLPKRGAGSRGGRVSGANPSVRFLNGATLRFMSGGGRDKSRAAFTARVLVVTEVDGMDEAGRASREADPMTQMEARTDAYASRRRIYGECTTSIEEGRIWTEYSNGTRSRIVMPCPHCSAFVLPERDHFTGWQDADNVIAAMNGAHWCCPECGAAWSEDERRLANQRALLVHRGQDIDEAGNVYGPMPETDTLGIRWTATHNLFWRAADIARREFNAQRAADEDSAEREMCQFVWALPHESPTIEVGRLDIAQLLARTTNDPRGVVPERTQHLAVGVDVGKYLCHYTVTAFADGASGVVIDYGRIEVPSRDFGVERALMMALREFRDQMCEAGWPVGSVDSSERMRPDAVCVDSRWQGEQIGVYPIYQFVNESPDRYHSVLGHGATQQEARHYARPKKIGRGIVSIHDGYHIVRMRTPRMVVVHADADYWKSHLHSRLTTPTNVEGALMFHHASGNEHLGFVRHLCAEHPVDEFIANKGVVVRWVQVSRANHWLDSTALASLAGHIAGVRLMSDSSEASTVQTDNDYWSKREQWR